MTAPFESAFDHLARVTRGLYGRRSRVAREEAMLDPVQAGHVFVDLLEKLGALTDAAELEHAAMLDDPKSEAWRAGMAEARAEVRKANERANAAIQERDAAIALVKAWVARLPNPDSPLSSKNRAAWEDGSTR